MFERFTDRARKVMALANEEARRFNHEYIGTEHILLGLVKEGSGVGANVLKDLNVSLRAVRIDVERMLVTDPELPAMGKLPQTPRAKKVIEYAIEESRNLGCNYVGTEHILLGLLRNPDDLAAAVLMQHGVTLENGRREILLLLGNSGEIDSEDSLLAAAAQYAPHLRNPEGLIQHLILSADANLQALDKDKTDAIHQGDYDLSKSTREKILQLIAIKTSALRLLLQHDTSLARLLTSALTTIKPGDTINAATLLLALIHSDPNLSARLAPLLSQIEAACRDHPPATPD